MNLFFYVCLYFPLPTRGESCTFPFTRLFPACVLRSRGCDPKIDFGTSSRRDVAIPRIHVEDRGDRSGERALVKKRLKGWKMIDEFMFFFFVFFFEEQHSLEFVNFQVQHLVLHIYSFAGNYHNLLGDFNKRKLRIII